MTQIITGDADASSNSLSNTIIDATNASPIVCETGTAHLYGDGDYVVVSGVTGNTAANGLFKIAVVDATHYSLVGSTGNGAYVSGGTCIDISFTPQFTVPSNGDTRDADSVNIGIEALADRTQLAALLLYLQNKFIETGFTASGTLVVPTDIIGNEVEIEGWGAGGGGGGGGQLIVGGASQPICGGGGGACAVRTTKRLKVVPGETLTITIGAAGAAGAVAADGGDGSNTTIAGLLGTVTFYGGQGGTKGIYCAGSVLVAMMSPGGQCRTGTTKPLPVVMVVTALTNGQMCLPTVNNGGGCGRGTSNTSVGSTGLNGSVSSEGYAGGVGGTAGGTVSPYYGGGGGGGGAGGPAGAGGAGGNGGTGANSSANTPGTAGTDAAPNSGAGGGGGGGGSSGNLVTDNKPGGIGGAGGSGYCKIRYTKRSA